ncbi:MAG TPA: MscL family protein [Ilumatobacteraceae bacterium]|jgi:large conductance mechanosensitive channel|nr:MscL family protein [Ilumatobacteraceae bacterium]
MKNFVQEFKAFIATGNLVEFAVGIILGLAIKAVIDAFMAGIVNPIIGAIVGKPNLDKVLTFTVRKGKTNESTISIGVVLTQLIALILVALVLFFVVKAYNRMRAPKEAAAPTEVDLLVQIRDELRTRG